MIDKSDITKCPSCGCAEGREHKSGCQVYKSLAMAFADRDTAPQTADEFILSVAPQNEDLE